MDSVDIRVRRESSRDMPSSGKVPLAALKITLGLTREGLVMQLGIPRTSKLIDLDDVLAGGDHCDTSHNVMGALCGGV